MSTRPVVDRPTAPSAGETINPGVVGTRRGGSRKNQATSANNTAGAIARYQTGVRANAIAAASKGGQHAWTTKGALRHQKIDEALFTLDVGQLSDIIETDQGFHIVRVLERKDEGRIPFTEAQAKIRKEIESQRKQELIQAEMVKLRKDSRVWTIFDGDLKGARVAEMLDRPKRR